jgi:hypothetical protein
MTCVGRTFQPIPLIPPNSGDDEDENADLRLWLTASGMFISFNAGEATSTSILGRVMDTGFRVFHSPEPESLD